MISLTNRQNSISYRNVLDKRLSNDRNLIGKSSKIDPIVVGMGWSRGDLPVGHQTFPADPQSEVAWTK